jgi:hypothetical protein
MSGQCKMNCNNPRRNRILLYCSQSTQTQPDSDHEAKSDSSDFPPIKDGERPLAVTDAMHRDIGLGQNNMLNMVGATAPVQYGKVSNHECKRVFVLITAIRPNPCQSETPEPEILLMNAHQKNGVFLLTMRTLRKT